MMPARQLGSDLLLGSQPTGHQCSSSLKNILPTKHGHLYSAFGSFMWRKSGGNKKTTLIRDELDAAVSENLWILHQ